MVNSGVPETDFVSPPKDQVDSQPPFNTGSFPEQQETKPELLTITINLGDGNQEYIVVHEGDLAKDLA